MSIETQSGNTRREDLPAETGQSEPAATHGLDNTTLPDRREASEGEGTKTVSKREAIATARAERAKAWGFVEQEDWEGNPQEWMTQDTFLSNKPLKQRLHAINQTVMNRDAEINEVKRQNQVLLEHVAKQQLQTLKDSRKAALEEDDSDKAEEITDQIADLKAEQKVQQAQAAVVPPPPRNDRIEQFQRDHEWFDKDPEMTDFASSYAQTLQKRRGGQWDDSIIDDMEKAVKRAFPEKFQNQRRQQASTVDTGKPAATSGKAARYTARDLDDAAYKTMQGLVKKGTLTEKEYINSLENVGYFNA